MEVVRNSLISVYNKTGAPELADELVRMNSVVWASGGTYKEIMEAGVAVNNVAELVGSEAILDHRVVTLSQEVHAGLLADYRADIDVKELERLGTPFLDLVCVDMYPIRQVIEADLSEKEIIENTDVGGPTLLHSAAKGRRVVLSLVKQRPVVLNWLRAGMPEKELVLRVLAGTAERQAANHLTQSADYLDRLINQPDIQNPYEGLLRQIGAVAAT